MPFRPHRPLVAGLLSASVSLAQALTFDLSFIPGTTAQEQVSFAAAASIWAAQFSDPVTVKLTVGTGSLPANVLGQAASRDLVFSYGSVRSALLTDISSASDSTAVGSLPVGSSFGMLINRTADNPNGSGSATPYVDNDGGLNNSSIRMSAANARALGFTLVSGGVGNLCTDCDAFIQFGTAFTWDHDRSNGIAASAYDFIGIAAHEIGHALGFISGIDSLDYFAQPANGGPYAANAFDDVSTLDLFRWSASSFASGVRDWTADARSKYFSINGGATVGPLFALGVTFGDGRQASHWKDGLGIGLLDPTAAQGEFLQVTANDVQALDVIGWNVGVVPEPHPAWLFAAGVGLVALRRRRDALAADTALVHDR